MGPVPLAYKFVAVAVMLTEINHCASRLKLDVPSPITREHIRRAMVVSPDLKGLGLGRIDVENYSFSFARSGQISYFTRLQPGTPYSEGLQPAKGESIKEHLIELSKRTSLIGTNEAYKMATNWLAAIDVDLERLTKEQSVEVKQLVALGNLVTPIFSLEWGNPAEKLPASGEARHRHPNYMYPRIKMLIAGDTKRLLELRQEDISYSKRPKDLIREREKLLAIPDDEFKKYSPAQQTNLVAKFGVTSLSKK
jgi:hypothetical protein